MTKFSLYLLGLISFLSQGVLSQGGPDNVNACNQECSMTSIQPVCGSDQKAYYNLCFLNQESCRQQQNNSAAVTVLEWNQCNCHVVCGRAGEGRVQEICGSDGRLYEDPCWLLLESCNDHQSISNKPMSFCGQSEDDSEPTEIECNITCSFDCERIVEDDVTIILCRLARENCRKHCSCEYPCPGGSTHQSPNGTVVYQNDCESSKTECRKRIKSTGQFGQSDQPNPPNPTDSTT